MKNEHHFKNDLKTVKSKDKLQLNKPERDHRNLNRMKKDGAGAHNWGSLADEAKFEMDAGNWNA